MATETVADPSASPEQRAVEADITSVLRTLVDELSPRRRTVIQTLFTDDPCSYNMVARIAGIPPGAIGPTRARALGQLRKMLSEREVDPRT